MVRDASKRFHTGERVINIGFMGNNYERELKAFKDEITDKGVKYRFVCDHEQLDVCARYGRWVEKVVDLINAG